MDPHQPKIMALAEIFSEAAKKPARRARPAPKLKPKPKPAELPEPPSEARMNLYLQCLAATGDWQQACKEAKVTMLGVREWRAAFPEFDMRCMKVEEALADVADAELYRRGIGWKEMVFVKGEAHWVFRYSDKCLMFYLAARRPEVYGDVRRAGKASGKALASLEHVPLLKVDRRQTADLRRQFDGLMAMREKDSEECSGRKLN